MMTNNKTIGLYIHIPFCSVKCPYCDFYSFNPEQNIKKEYVNKICEDLKKCDYKFDTVYFGGGTPSKLDAQDIADVLSCAGKTDDAEITVECNPSDVSGIDGERYFEVLASAGVNRISMGLQSAVDAERKALGRKAGKAEVERALLNIRNAGIDNISLDLMLGIPRQTENSLKYSIDFCLESGIKHLSAYILKIEEGTHFYKVKDNLNLPDEDTVCDFYLKTSQLLRESGFKHYEISNFALPGYESRHNLKYWKDEEYLGLGPSAHSFLNGTRYYYPNDIGRYLNGENMLFESSGGDAEEYMMLALRLDSGIDFADFEKKFSLKLKPEFYEKCKFYSDKSFADFNSKRFNLNPNGFIISNSVISDLINLL